MSVSSGEVKEKTEWDRVVIFAVVVFAGVLANIAEKYVAKGSKLCIEGQLQTCQYQDNGVQKCILTNLKPFEHPKEVLFEKTKREISPLRKACQQHKNI